MLKEDRKNKLGKIILIILFLIKMNFHNFKHKNHSKQFNYNCIIIVK